FRKIFADQVPAYIVGNAEAHTGCGRGESPHVSRVVQITQGLGADGAEPFRIIRHAAAGVGARHKAVRQGMAEPGRAWGAGSKAIVARVLPEQRRIEKDAEEVTGGVVQAGCAEPFSIPGCALADGGLIMRKMCGSGFPRGAGVVDGISRALHEHMKLVRRIQRTGAQVALVSRHVYRGALNPLREPGYDPAERAVVVVHVKRLRRTR